MSRNKAPLATAVPLGAGAGARQLPSNALVVANGTLEALKWLALILMTLDHVNKYLLAGAEPVLFALGRLAMPLFVFVLAYNLARPGALAKGLYPRTMKRLALFGALAAVPHMALGHLLGGWWPLNILFTLLAATAILYLVDSGSSRCQTMAIAVFAGGGVLVEYWWPALALAVACWLYCRRPVPQHAAGLVLAILALWVVNGSPWALAAVPIIFAASRLQLRVPRVRLLFYAYYPAHLAVLWLLTRSAA